MPRSSARNMSLWLLGLMAASIASLTPVRAVVRYVDPAAPGPEHDGASWRTAYQAVGPALVAATAGDEVRVAAGGYGEAVTLKQGITLLGGFPGVKDPDGARDPVVHASILLGGGSGPVVSAPVGLTEAAVLNGFTLQAESSTGVYSASASPTLSNLVFDQSRTGVSCGAGGAPRIMSCVFRQCDTGVYALNTSPILAGNLFIGNGIGARLSNSNGTLVNNTAVWCGTGFAFAGGSATVANSLFAFNETGLRGDGGGVSLRHNLVYANGLDYSGLEDPTGRDGNVRTDPLFADPDTNDYHLRPGSPAIDAGANADVRSDYDLDGLPRIQDARVDIGVYEFTRTPAADPAEALRRAAGLAPTSSTELPTYDLETAPPSSGVVDILDVVRIIRSRTIAGAGSSKPHRG